MATSKIEGEGYFQIDNDFFNEETNKIINSIIPQLEKSLKSYLRFNIIFLILIALEAFSLVAFFSLLIQSSILAVTFALFFLTLFSYIILRLYFQTKKPEQFEDFKERYTRACKSILKYREGIPEHHIALANGYTRLAMHLQGKEYSLIPTPRFFESLKPTLEKLSCRTFWLDLHKIKELLLLSAVEEHIKLVKCEPTSLDVHAALANAYVTLSGLYVDPRKFESYDEDRWIPNVKFTEQFEATFRDTAQKAIEEFKILNDYAPNDPWVHTQLAYSYHDLQMPIEEIKEFETILKLRPDDKDTLFKLGCLYFQQGQNAQGLKAYESLRCSNYKKAEQLIAHYGRQKRN